VRGYSNTAFVDQQVVDGAAKAQTLANDPADIGQSLLGQSAAFTSSRTRSEGP
jgi:hypothetical protein